MSYYKINNDSSEEYTTLSHEFQGVSKAGSYGYYVQACNASGCGPATATVTETITSGGGGCKTCAPTEAPPTSTSSGATAAPSAGTTIPSASASENLSINGSVNPVPGRAIPSGAVVSDPNPVLTALTHERRTLIAGLYRQPSEAVMQADVTERAQASLPSLLPPAPAKDVAAWNAWDTAYKQTHPNGPDYAPPEYIAYSSAKLVPATSTPYRFEIQYQYDPASGALTTVEDAQTGFVYWQAAMGGAAPVDAFGHLLGWTDGNNVSTVMGYDTATGAPVGIGTGTDSAPFGVQQLTYAWDGYGNLEQRQNANQNLGETFTYDNLNRLITSNVTNPAENGPSLAFHYGPMGNIQTKTLTTSSGPTLDTYNYDPSHPYAVDTVTNTSGTVYSASYDANGNMLTRNGSPISWTVDNLPDSIDASAGSSTFSYGPDGQRYYQAATFNSATTDTTYISGLFEVVATQTDTFYWHNIMAGGQVIAVHSIDENGTAFTNYLHYDHLGSVDTLTDDQGIIAQQMSFDAFGQRRDPCTWTYVTPCNQGSGLKSMTDRGYTYQEQLDNVGLIHMNGRVYDPGIGRFISADPTVPDPLYSQAFNRYSYVYNSPLEYTDPSGYQDISQYTMVFCTYTPCIFKLVPPTPTNAGNTGTADLGTIIVHALAPTNIAATSTNSASAAPVAPGNSAPISTGKLLPLLPPLQPDCASYGGCQEPWDLQEIGNWAGFQTWDGVCFGCGTGVSFSFDPELHDPNGKNDVNVREALQNMVHVPNAVTGPMPYTRPMLGTVGKAEPNPIPDPNANGGGPGGPYEPAGPGQLPGHFYGPEQPSGPRTDLQFVPPNGSQPGYWKIKTPNSEGWQRYNMNWEPISPEDAHPGFPEEGLPLFIITPPGAALGIGLILVFYPTPAY